ncbi:MAG: DegT/DnrJ/EryC1/StrS family aminotransferase [Xanthomonadales bacterium]|jgi:perosamine synthetase|nr:DegT/DnrJ/EryC1/StrS family aminotransferase [Xanthomonadales bacterium]
MIPVNLPNLGVREKELLSRCIETGWISSEGQFVREFEQQMASHVGRKFGIAVCNGTAALDIAVDVLRISPGDEVIVPTFTIISCVHQIVRAGARPVFVDCDPETWNMRIDEVEQKITARTRAVMAVHIYGLPVDMDPLLDLVSHHGLRLIEDAAELIGQTYTDRACGSFGDLSTFSFYPNKHVTTGEGGMIVTDDEELAERCRSKRNLCFQTSQRFVHEELGWNYRMTNLQAALGIAQLERLDTSVARKREIGKFYNDAFCDQEHLQLPLPVTDYAENIYWVYGIVLRDSCSLDAAEMIGRLAQADVGARPFFWPMHEQPVLVKMGLAGDETCPVAERLARRGLYLPSGLGTGNEDLTRVAEVVRDILK